MPSVPGIAYSIEFFAGRRSRDQAISTVKQTAETVNKIANDSAAKAGRARQAQHDKDLQDLQQSSADATEKRVEGVKKSSEAAAKASADAMKILSENIPNHDEMLDPDFNLGVDIDALMSLFVLKSISYKMSDS